MLINEQLTHRETGFSTKEPTFVNTRQSGGTGLVFPYISYACTDKSFVFYQTDTSSLTLLWVRRRAERQKT